MADLSQRLFRLSAELGDLYLKRRAIAAARDNLTGQLGQGDELIARKEHEIEVIRQLRAEQTTEAAREAEAQRKELPTLPDLPERPVPTPPCREECCAECSGRPCTCGTCPSE
jgi:hypothetical protein